ncbi:MAG: hypothetical protein PVF56_13215 [Desulfobacterales bacterium]
MTASFLIPALRANDLKSVAVVNGNVVAQGMAESDVMTVMLSTA